jgi:hypothetical protein
LNPYASYGASTSSRNDDIEGIQGRESTSTESAPGTLATPGKVVCNDLCNEGDIRRALASAAIAGDDVEVDRLRALLRPRLRVVK